MSDLVVSMSVKQFQQHVKKIVHEEVKAVMEEILPDDFGEHRDTAQPAEDEPYLSRKELAAALNVSLRLIDQMKAEKKIPYTMKFGKKPRYLLSDVRKALKGDYELIWKNT